MQLVQRDRTIHHLPWLSNLSTKLLWYSIHGSLTCPTTTVSGFSDGTHLPVHVGIQALMSKFLSGQAELLSAVKTVCASLIINHYYDCSSNHQWWINPVAACRKKATFLWPTFTQPQCLNHMYYVNTNSILWKTCPAYLVGELQLVYYKSYT